MCGIFGLFVHSDADWQQQLIAANEHRGSLGGGCVAYGPAHTYLDYVRSFYPARLTRTADIWLAHTRAPTGANNHDLSELHPIESKDFFLAHNGLLLGDPKPPDMGVLPDLRRRSPYPDTDTGFMAWVIQDSITNGESFPEAIAHFVSNYKGQQACWLLDKASLCVYLWRVMSPIFVGSAGFSSTQLLEGLTTEGKPIGPIFSEPLDEGVVYCYDPRVLPYRLRPVAHFEFETPYSY